MRQDDRTLVEAVVAGRTECFAVLVDRHAAAVFRLVRSTIRHTADAEDIAQEVFWASYRSLPRLRDPARFRAHLLVIAARKVADFLRRKGRRGRFVALAEEPLAPPPRGATRTEAPDRIDEIVRQLSPRNRLLFALRHHEGLSCVQIAKVMEVPAGTVYSRLSRIHGAIRRALGVADR